MGQIQPGYILRQRQLFFIFLQMCRCVMISISFFFLGGGFISAVCDSVGVVDWVWFLIFWEAGYFLKYLVGLLLFICSASCRVSS
jgi:hypothetical protein